MVDTMVNKIWNTLRKSQNNNHLTMFCCCDTIRYDTIRYDTIRYDTIRYDTTRHDTTRHDTTRHDTTRHDTTRHDTTRHDTTRHDTIRYDVSRLDTLFLDAVCVTYMELLVLFWTVLYGASMFLIHIRLAVKSESLPSVPSNT